MLMFVTHSYEKLEHNLSYNFDYWCKESVNVNRFYFIAGNLKKYLIPSMKYKYDEKIK